MASGKGKPTQILHLLPDACHAGSRRTALLLRELGGSYRHAIVAARPEERGWLAQATGAGPKFLADFPPLGGWPAPGRLQKIARAMLPYDVVVTHGYPAMNAVMARTMFSEGLRPPPLIHHEWEDDAGSGALTRRKRDLYRQLALGRSAGLVVPDEALEARALHAWQQPLGRVKHLPDAVEVRAFAKPPKPDSLPGIIKRQGELWIGVADADDREHGLAAAAELIRPLPENCVLVWAAPGDPRREVREAADAAGVIDRMYPLAGATELRKYIGLFDIALVPPGTEWPREAVLAAIASGAPVVAEESSDLVELLAEENRTLLQQPLPDVLHLLATRAEERRKVGEANRRRALAEFDQDKLLASYRRLFDSAVDQTQRTR